MWNGKWPSSSNRTMNGRETPRRFAARCDVSCWCSGTMDTALPACMFLRISSRSPTTEPDNRTGQCGPATLRTNELDRALLDQLAQCADLCAVFARNPSWSVSDDAHIDRKSVVEESSGGPGL